VKSEAFDRVKSFSRVTEVFCFPIEESVWEREVQQRQTIWQCMTESPFEKFKNNVKL